LALQTTFYVDYNHLNRASPTMLIGEAVRLSSMYPDFGLKDYSGDSFPGDHAAVLFTWLGYCLFFVRNKWTPRILFVVVLFVMPRLMAGVASRLPLECI
jgi:membrane-associated phospholipid phosphatase